MYKVEVSKQDWINAAVENLAAEGPGAVLIEPLGRSLGLTKGSFYWHFKDREELLEAVLNEWEGRESERLRANANAPPAERLVHLLEVATEPGASRLETALCDWARQDMSVAERLRAIERLRISFLAQLLADLGFTAVSAEEWAQTVYLAFLGAVERSSRLEGNRATRQEITDRISRLILAAAVVEGQPAAISRK
jgi:AcrR family transcriptional regulator